MVNIFDCCNNSNSFTALQSVKDKLQKESDAKKHADRDEMEANYKATHIFKTYDEALDYMEHHPGEPISWHAREISYQKSDGKFKSYEQDYSFDGVMCYDVVRHYTREQLLEQVNDHKEWIWNKYPEYAGKEFWLNEYGTLSYVKFL